MKSEALRRSKTVRRTMMRAVLFSPDRILSMECVLGLTSQQVERVEAVARSGGTVRDLMEEVVEAAEKQLEDAFEAEPLDTTAILAAALVVRQGDNGRFARMMLDAAVVRSVLTKAQREAAATTISGLASVPPSKGWLSGWGEENEGRVPRANADEETPSVRGPSMFVYARDTATSKGE